MSKLRARYLKLVVIENKFKSVGLVALLPASIAYVVYMMSGNELSKNVFLSLCLFLTAVIIISVVISILVDLTVHKIYKEMGI